MCRSVGSPVIAKSPTKAGVDQLIAAPFGALLGLLVADDPEPHPHRVLVAQRRRHQHHRRDRALHVIGAAPVEPVALEPRLELVAMGGDDVDMALEHHRRRVRPAADLGLQHRQPPHGFPLGLDVPCRQPGFDEPGALDDRRRLSGPVGDQALGEADELGAHAGVPRDGSPVVLLRNSVAHPSDAAPDVGARPWRAEDRLHIAACGDIPTQDHRPPVQRKAFGNATARDGALAPCRPRSRTSPLTRVINPMPRLVAHGTPDPSRGVWFRAGDCSWP